MKLSYEAKKKNVQSLRHTVKSKTLNLEIIHTKLHTNQQNYTLYLQEKFHIKHTNSDELRKRNFSVFVYISVQVLT